MKGKNNLILATALLAIGLPAFAQSNNFFGQNVPPGAVGDINSEKIDSTTGGKSPGMVSGSPAGGDYTQDEKRMQKKYKANINHAKDLIEKGEGMMKGAKGDTNNKDYKKGKIIKEIGEKSLAELQANNPFPTPEKPEKGGKEKKGEEKKEL